MEYVVFIYFVLMFLYIYKKRGVDVSSYVALLYCVTTFFAIILHNTDYFYKNIELNVVPTFLFCFLTTLAIIPLYKFKLHKVDLISCRSIKFIDFMVYYFFASTIIMLFAYRNDIIFRLLFGDFAAMRGDSDLGLTKYPAPIELVLTPIRATAGFSQIMLFVLIFSITYLEKPLRYNLMALIGSLPVIIQGVLGIDRSKTFYWIILLGLSFAIFWKNMSIKTKKKIMPFIFVVVAVLGSYFTIVTLSRFGDSDEGAGSSVVSYAGQSYLNFCYFWDEYKGDGFSTRYLFPATHRWIIGDYTDGTTRQADLTLSSGMQTGVFYTYLGSFLVDTGKIGPFMITVVYLLLMLILENKKRKVITFELLLVLFILATIPACGIISYIYTTPYVTISIIFILFMMRLLKKKEHYYIPN